jgi:hypothetical protein
MAVPANSLERIEEGLRRSLRLLPGDARAKLSELAEPETLLGFAIVLGVWGGLQLTPLGIASDLLLSAWGYLNLGRDGYELVMSAVAASDASDDSTMDAAAARLSKAIVAVGVDVIAAAVANPIFKSIRTVAGKIRGSLPKTKLLRGPIPEVIASAGAGMGTAKAAPPVGKAAVGFLKFALPVAGGLALLGVILARRGASSSRKVFP